MVTFFHTKLNNYRVIEFIQNFHFRPSKSLDSLLILCDWSGHWSAVSSKYVIKWKYEISLSLRFLWIQRSLDMSASYVGNNWTLPPLPPPCFLESLLNPFLCRQKWWNVPLSLCMNFALNIRNSTILFVFHEKDLH